MDGDQYQRAVAALAALLIPHAREATSMIPERLDSTGDIERSLVHEQQ